MLELSSALLKRIEECALEATPNEACGLLVGIKLGARRFRVDTCEFSSNVTESDPTEHFEIDPSLYIRLQKETRMSDRCVVGVWHSHPAGTAYPSETDKRRSVGKDWIWLITAVDGTTAETKAHITTAIDPEVFSEVLIHTIYP